MGRNSRRLWAEVKEFRRQYEQTITNLITMKNCMRLSPKTTALLFVFIAAFLFNTNAKGQVTTATLLQEMIDLDRLTYLPQNSYRTICYSSYDRQSTAPDKPEWFANSDGFGREVVPNFESVIKEPESRGTGDGTYLICDVEGPGAIARMWTARIAGDIRLLLDGKLIYEGNAEDFFWNLPNKLSGDSIDIKNSYRQFDALYFPIPFAKRCRIEWIGNAMWTHFYQVEVKLFGKGTKVKTFQPSDLNTYKSEIEEVGKILIDPDKYISLTGEKERFNAKLLKKESKEIARFEGTNAIEELRFKVSAQNIDIALRNTILRIFFDNSSIPQIESPLGDFFAAAPGINPYVSLPMSVGFDSTMISRFIMPFKKNAYIELENISDMSVEVDLLVSVKPYDWDENTSMHMRAKWRNNYGLSTKQPVDMPYLLAMGQGRFIGVATHLLNPSNVPSSHGNWWGEGDEKIFVDDNRSPVFFGTGSEDYYNYSWSSDRIFFYPYCGQPRNDGPANRGFVSNFRWHINDDILFSKQFAFYMELMHHGEVHDLAYARMAYLYAREGLIDDHNTITKAEIGSLEVPEWNPVALKGSMFNSFVNAEYVVNNKENTSIEYDNLWAEGKMLVWKPTSKGDKIEFSLKSSKNYESDICLSLAEIAKGGKIKIYVNGEAVSREIDLCAPGRKLNRSHYTEKFNIKEGTNTLTIENVSDKNGVEIGIDFFWLRN